MDVGSVLREERARSARLRDLVEIKRDESPLIDVGHLLCGDARPLESETMTDASAMETLARENTQLLINEIWQLPVTKDVHGVFAKMPTGTTPLPREKPLPEDRPQTRFEKYAEMKGMQKRKKSRMVYDENKDEWRPRWGYNKANDELAVPYIELPDQAD
eukprot:UC1_evm2s1929